MSTLSRWILRRVRGTRRKLRLETLGLTVPPFTATFKVKQKRNKTTIVTKLVHVPQPAMVYSPLTVFMDMMDTMVDTERRRAIRRKDWETAIVTSLVQGYLRHSRRQLGGLPG